MMILIVGANGRLGRFLEGAMEKRFPDRVVAATREEIDLTDPDRVIMELERLDPRPTTILNCAAVTDPDMAERTPEQVLLVNREGVSCLARASREIGCRLIHFSTGQVFDGKKKVPYVEEDTPTPTSQYGRIRYLGELAAAEGNPDHLVLRLSLLCGDGAQEDPIRVMLRAAKSRDNLEWSERRVSPMFADDLASIMPTILASGWRGVLHLANTGSCFLSEMAVALAMRIGESRTPELTGGPGPSSFRPGGGPNQVLDVARFCQLSGRRIRSWESALADTLNSEKRN